MSIYQAKSRFGQANIWLMVDSWVVTRTSGHRSGTTRTMRILSIATTSFVKHYCRKKTSTHYQVHACVGSPLVTKSSKHAQARKDRSVNNRLWSKHGYLKYPVGGLEHQFHFPIQLGISSSQQTFTHIVQVWFRTSCRERMKSSYVKGLRYGECSGV